MYFDSLCSDDSLTTTVCVAQGGHGHPLDPPLGERKVTVATKHLLSNRLNAFYAFKLFRVLRLTLFLHCFQCAY